MVGAEGRVRRDQLIWLLAQGSSCHWCSRALDFDRPRGRRPVPDDATLDHLVPLSRGGRGSIDNIVLSCFGCNKVRSVIEQRARAATVVGVAADLRRRDVLLRLRESVGV
jgi:5-methylcytosine-specific restriction endonuclease McrA